MVNVSVEGTEAVFEVEGFDKLWAFRSRLQIPLAHIINVEANTEQVGRWWHGLKIIGTEVPGLFAAGTFRFHGEIVFWDVRDSANAIILSLDHERYRKLIIEVTNPIETVERVRLGIASVTS